LPVEEVIQNNQELVDLPLVAEEQVLAIDDETDTDLEEFPQVQLLIPLVDIILFPEFNNLQPLTPEEFPEEELLGWINGVDNAIQPPQNENIQLGFVQMQDSWPQHPTFGPCPEAIKQWVNHFFGPSTSSTTVLIPDVWMNFFLLSFVAVSYF